MRDERRAGAGGRDVLYEEGSFPSRPVLARTQAVPINPARAFSINISGFINRRRSRVESRSTFLLECQVYCYGTMTLNQVQSCVEND